MTEEAPQRGQALIVMAVGDDVATALRTLSPGEEIAYRIPGGGQGTVVVRQEIPFGHKIALRDIAQGSHVRKYGAVIGQATEAVATGHHVHVHNLAGIRGRGDLARAARASGEKGE
jgi:altronate dehydratase small subunit